MDRRTPSIEEVVGGDQPAGDSPGAVLRDGSEAAPGKVVELGAAFVRQVRHVWPDFDTWLEQLEDTRYQPFVTYPKQFIMWCGLAMFLCEMGSRRQIDFDLREIEGFMLDNLNRLTGCKLQTLPVHKTLDHAFGHIGSKQVANVQTKAVSKLIRGKMLGDCRLFGWLLIATDGTGHVSFKKRHCPHCLEFHTADGCSYQHRVLEAKIVSPSGLAISIASEFIENPSPEGLTSSQYEKLKQDCELKAFGRLADTLKARFPHLPICILGDSLLACGPVIDICQHNHWAYILTFKPGRTPALWQEFQALSDQTPQNSLAIQPAEGTRRLYRWVNELPFDDKCGHHHCLDALLLEETVEGKTTTFSWITSIRLNPSTVDPVATRGGRTRWKIENQGFNHQKNSGLNLEHAYSLSQDGLKIFYTLLQIADMMMQLFCKGNILGNVARRYGATPIKLFGSLKNISRRLLECLRYFRIPDSAFDTEAARHIQLRLDTS